MVHDEAWPQELVVLICGVEGLPCSSLLLMEDKPSTDHQSLSQSCMPWPSALPVPHRSEPFHSLVPAPQSLALG